MKNRLVILLVSLAAGSALAGNQVDNVSALRVAADFATRAGNDVASMDARVAFYRSSHKRPTEHGPVPKVVEDAIKNTDVWRVLFYVDTSKSIGLRGRTLCVYVTADTGKPIGSLHDCAIQ